jgi:hypothetical protein
LRPDFHLHSAEKTPYLDIMKFEPDSTPVMLGPLLIERALSNVAVFGADSVDIESTVKAALKPASPGSITTDIANGLSRPPREIFQKAKSTAQKLRAIRSFVREDLEDSEQSDALQSQLTSLNLVRDAGDEMPLASNGAESCREMHEALLSILTEAQGLPRDAQCVVDHSMLLRAKEMYLFDAVKNRDVVGDDPWTRFVWDWIAGKCPSIVFPLQQANAPKMLSTLPRMEAWSYPTWISATLGFSQSGRTIWVSQNPCVSSLAF